MPGQNAEPHGTGKNKTPHRRSNQAFTVPEHDRLRGELTDTCRLSGELTDQHRSSGELTEQAKHMDYMKGLSIVKITNTQRMGRAELV